MFLWCYNIKIKYNLEITQLDGVSNLTVSIPPQYHPVATEDDIYDVCQVKHSKTTIHTCEGWANKQPYDIFLLLRYICHRSAEYLQFDFVLSTALLCPAIGIFPIIAIIILISDRQVIINWIVQHVIIKLTHDLSVSGEIEATIMSQAYCIFGGSPMVDTFLLTFTVKRKALTIKAVAYPYRTDIAMR